MIENKVTKDTVEKIIVYRIDYTTHRKLLRTESKGTRSANIYITQFSSFGKQVGISLMWGAKETCAVTQ